MPRAAAAILGVVLLLGSAAGAQTRVPQNRVDPKAPFETGDFLIGPSLLIGGLDGGGIALGVEGEYGLTKNESLGAGTIGISFRGHTYTESESSFGYTAKLRVTPIAVGANYHFVLSDRRLDPYIGLAIGYASASYSDNAGTNFSTSSGTYLMIDGGGRYVLNPRTAIQAGLSLGSRGDVGLLRVAAMFKI